MSLVSQLRAIVHPEIQDGAKARIDDESKRHGRIRKLAAADIREHRALDHKFQQEVPPSRMHYLCGRDNRRFLRHAARAGGENQIVGEWLQEQRAPLRSGLEDFRCLVERHIDALTGEDVTLCGITRTSHSEILIEMVEDAVLKLGKPHSGVLCATELSFDGWEKLRRDLSREAARVSRSSGILRGINPAEPEPGTMASNLGVRVPRDATNQEDEQHLPALDGKAKEAVDSGLTGHRDDQLVTVDEAAKNLELPPRTIRNWIEKGDKLQPVDRLGGPRKVAARYRLGDIIKRSPDRR